MADDAKTIEAPARAHRKPIGALLLELMMIGVGVFLGATAEQWRDTRHHRALVTASLQNFHREMLANRGRIQARREYHEALGKGVLGFMSSDGPPTLQRLLTAAKFRGMQPVDLEHTAWDLALATQALGDIDPPLALAISHVYSVQQGFVSMQSGFMANALSPATFANANNATGLAIAMSSYLGDVNIQEPGLMQLYDRVVPRIDSVLGPAGVPRDTVPKKT